MKEGFIIKANWIMFKKPILDNLYLLGVKVGGIYRNIGFWLCCKTHYKIEAIQISKNVIMNPGGMNHDQNSFTRG